MKTSVYIHIPFCRQKCAYCDFLSFPADRSAMIAYLDGLRREATMRARELVEREITVDTLYIGGGTPTALALPELNDLLSLCLEILPLHNPEWTVEANPCTIDRDKVMLMAGFGVNRISLGVQDTHNHRLALLGRTHTAARARQAFSLCRDTFPSVSCDLMNSLPGQTVGQSIETLQEVCAWGPDHISAYGLKVENDTPLGRMVLEGTVDLPAEDEALEMMEAGRNILLSRGYHHYEIANFARPGHQCRHNRTYWENRPYLGLGLGAHSYWDGLRSHNVTGLEAYTRLTEAGRLPSAESVAVTRRQEMEDTMMLGLRLIEGVSYESFAARFGCDLRQEFAGELQPLQENRLIEATESGVRLTGRGLPLANLVFAAFIRI
jgi:oxygen-independent coproporphyrinogen III oxidase